MSRPSESPALSSFEPKLTAWIKSNESGERTAEGRVRYVSNHANHLNNSHERWWLGICNWLGINAAAPPTRPGGSQYKAVNPHARRFARPVGMSEAVDGGLELAS